MEPIGVPPQWRLLYLKKYFFMRVCDHNIIAHVVVMGSKSMNSIKSTVDWNVCQMYVIQPWYLILLALKYTNAFTSLTRNSTPTGTKAQTTARKCKEMQYVWQTSCMHRSHEAIWDGKRYLTKVFDITFTLEKGRVKITNGKYGALEDARGTGKVNHKWIISFGTAASAGVKRSVYHSAAPRWRY